MKIGLSLSRCVRDIFLGKVNETEVLVIITRTDFNPHNDNHWNSIWDGYTQGGLSHPEWRDIKDDYNDVRRLVIRLYDCGKIHQPRQFGTNPSRFPYYWLDCILTPEDADEIPAVKEAWEHYKVVANLCS